MNSVRVDGFIITAPMDTSDGIEMDWKPQRKPKSGI